MPEFSFDTKRAGQGPERDGADAADSLRQARASRVSQAGQSDDVRRAQDAAPRDGSPALGEDISAEMTPGSPPGASQSHAVVQHQIGIDGAEPEARFAAGPSALSPDLQAFLSEQGIEAGDLDDEALGRLGHLLQAARAAHTLAAGGEADASALADVEVTINRTESPSGLDLEVIVIAPDASLAFTRTVDLAGGSVRRSFRFQDTGGDQLYSESEHQPQWQELARMPVEMPRERLPATPRPTAIEGLDDFSDLIGPPAEADTEGVGAFVDGMILGDFADNDSFSAIAGQTVVGFIPIAGQIADVRDLSAAMGRVGSGEDGGWLSVGIAIAGFIPGLDFLKGGSHLGRRALRDAAEESIDDIARSGMKHAGQQLAAGSARRAGRLLRQLAAGRAEMIERLTRLADEGVLQPNTLSRIRSATSSLRDHLTPADLSGALRDKLGVPVRVSGSGATWDHLGEVESALNSLRLARRSLLRELRHIEPGGDVYRRLSEEAESLRELVRVTQTFLETR